MERKGFLGRKGRTGTNGLHVANRSANGPEIDGLRALVIHNGVAYGRDRSRKCGECGDRETHDGDGFEDMQWIE